MDRDQPSGDGWFALAALFAVLSLGWLVLNWFDTVMPHSSRPSWDDMPGLCVGPVLGLVATFLGWRVARKIEDASWTVWPALIAVVCVGELAFAAAIVS